jgi:hypothetical protein
MQVSTHCQIVLLIGLLLKHGLMTITVALSPPPPPRIYSIFFAAPTYLDMSTRIFWNVLSHDQPCFTQKL